MADETPEVVTPSVDATAAPTQDDAPAITTDSIFAHVRALVGADDPTDDLVDPSQATATATPATVEPVKAAEPAKVVAPVVAAPAAIPGAYLKAAASAGYTAEDFAGMTPSDVKDFINSLPKAAFKDSTTDGRNAVSGNVTPKPSATFTLPELPDLVDDGSGAIDSSLIEYAKALKASFKTGLESVVAQAETKIAEAKQEISGAEQRIQNRIEGEKMLQRFDAEILKDDSLKGIVGAVSVYELEQTSAEYKNREMLIGKAAAFVGAGMTLAKAIKTAAEECFPDKIAAARTASENAQRQQFARNIAAQPKGQQIGGSPRPKASPAPIPSRQAATDPFALTAQKLDAAKQEAATNGARA